MILNLLKSLDVTWATLLWPKIVYSEFSFKVTHMSDFIIVLIAFFLGESCNEGYYEAIKSLYVGQNTVLKLPLNKSARNMV